MSDRIVVFNDGRIEQVGPPAEVYERPASPFVAGFVGTSNLLRGDAAAALIGQPGTLSVRPEKIRVGPADALVEIDRDGEMTAAGVVAEAIYAGSFDADSSSPSMPGAARRRAPARRASPHGSPACVASAYSFAGGKTMSTAWETLPQRIIPRRNACCVSNGALAAMAGALVRSGPAGGTGTTAVRHDSRGPGSTAEAGGT